MFTHIKNFFMKYQYTIKRWADILLLFFIGGLATLALSPLIITIFNKMEKLYTNIHPSLFYIFLYLLSATIWWIIIQLKGFNRKHRTLVYPPAYLAGLAYYFFIFPICFFIDDKETLLKLYGQVLTILVGFETAIYIQYCKFKINPSEDKNSNSLKNEDDKTAASTIIQWISKEEPIKELKDDLLNDLTPYIKRLTSIILSKEFNSISIIGGFGSGKSSLINIVDGYIAGSKHIPDNFEIDKETSFKGKILTCKADAWGRQNQTIAKQILKIIIDEMSKNVDALSLISIPDNYIKALGGSKNSFLGFISHILISDAEPEKLLKKIDFILKASNLRVLIYIEDIDRNTSDEHIKEELPSLLDRLAKMDNISFILAIGTGNRNTEAIIRVCEHLEYLL